MASGVDEMLLVACIPSIGTESGVPNRRHSRNLTNPTKIRNALVK